MGMQVYLNYKRRRFAMSPHVGMMIALTYTLIPIIYKLISKENFFIKENMIIFACFFFSIFSLSMLNWAMLKLLEIFFDMKLMFKKNIISMLDPKFAIQHNMPQILPFIVESSPQNLMQFMNLVQMMQ
jgi:hypothetical protein